MILAETPTVDQLSPEPVAKLDQHARHRVGSALENPDPEIDEFEIFDKALIFAEILAQGEVERIDRTLALGGRDQGLAIDVDLDDRLRHRDEIALRIVAALDIDAKALDFEIIRHFPKHPAGEQARTRHRRPHRHSQALPSA